ncbi:MAG: hypothetical protein J6Q51_01275, partial [Clostridia bacterium]|nr:hypothetical protein [Clostridia bacterium]
VTLIDEAKSKIVLGEKGKTGSDFAVTGFSKTLSGDDNSNSWFGLNSDAKDIALTVDLTSSTAQVYIGYVKIARGQTKITGAKVTKNEVTQGSDITETATAPTGYEFVGWSLHSYSTSAQSPENSNYNTTYTTAEIKLTLNVSKAGRVNLAYSPFIYIIAVYRAKLYTVDFATTVTDGPSKAALTTSLVYPGQKTVQVEFAKTYTKAEYIALFPTLTINGMYNFTGWDSTTNGSNTVLYQNGAWNTAEFKLNDSANLNNAQGTVTFSVIYTAKTIKINLFVDGTDSGKDGSVVYGTNVYNMGGFTPSKKAYNFTGWEYSGTMYAPATGTAKVYDIQLAEVRFDAKFVEKEIPLVISAGTNGQKFPNGQNEIKGGTIKVGQNNITSAIFDKDFKLTAVPTWDATFAKFEFRGFIFVNSDKVIIPTGYENNNFTKGKTSYVFTAEDIDDGSATPVVTIYAYYEMVDITNPSAGADAVDTAWSISGNNCSFTYDAGNHNLRITEDNKASGIIKYSYNWKRSGTTVSSKNTAAIKTVAESGKYVCQVTATTNVFNAMGTIVEDSNEVNVTVNKKKLDVTQNGKPVTKSEPIVKTFDNTIKVDAEDNVDYLGKCGSDVVVVNITFPNVNVGSNYQLIPELSGKDSNNYYVDTTTLYGKVIQYVLHLELKDTAEDFVYKVGADNKQINIKEKYQLVEEDTAFLTKNGFSFDYTIVTNQNKIGQYTHNGATNKFVYTLTVGAAGAQSANFDIQAVPFRIIDKDANSLVVNIMVVTNDYPGKTDEVISSSIAILTATGLPESSSGNKTSEIIVIETKDYFKSNKDIPLQLGIQSAYASYYRVEKWKVLLDNSEQANSFGTSSNITYTVTNTTVKEITIRVYITRLKTITLDYNVVNKSEVTQGYLEDLKTVIALGETVNTSKNTYNSNFPLTVVRPGWKFNGWKVNNTVVKSDTLWTFQGDKLVASWSIDDIVVDANQKSINSVYTGDSITETIEIKNKNETSLTYSYAWTTTATVPGSYSNATLTVKDVNNSGTYTLTITASDGSLSITKTCTIVVKIQKYQLLKDNISIDKEYDADSSAVYVVTGVKSEVITISGNYYGSAAGSKLNKATLSYKGKIDKTTIEIDINNYSIDAKYISEDSKINVKQITFSPENQSKSYSRNDKTPLVYTGNYNVGKVKFSYQISTPSAEVGEYKDDALVVTIISGDVESNFSFTVQSTFTIGKEKLNNSNISWIGDTKVTFDGKSHKLELQPELQDIVAKYTY